MFWLLIEFGNFVHASLVPSAREFCTEKTLRRFYDLIFGQNPRAQRQHVGIVMFPAHSGSQRVMRHGGANASDFICSHGHADSGAANQNPQVIAPLLHAPRNFDSKIRVINRFF